MLNVEKVSRGDSLTIKDYAKALGPAIIVVAGIIGPGTITTMSVVGADYGFKALWIVMLACIFAYFYQEPATRFTIQTGMSVLEGIRKYIGKPVSVFLFSTVLVGAIAFQAGNFTGAALALNYFTPEISITTWALTMAIVALVIVWIGVYQMIENINKVLITLMIIAFVLTAFTAGPQTSGILVEGFSFNTLGGDYWLILALLATTMPPNIVLGLSSFIRAKYENEGDIQVEKEMKLAKFDLRFSMVATLLISGAIVVSAGAIIHPQGITIENAAHMAEQLTPILGTYAGILFSLGLWAAAFSSGVYQITLASRFLNEAIGKEIDPKAFRSRIVMVLASLLPVAVILIFEDVPVSIIITAQSLNGLALPLVAGTVLFLANNKRFLGEKVNNFWQNLMYSIILVVVSLLALRVFLGLFGIIS